MKIKIEIKNRFTGKVLFELESEGNTVKNTVVEAVKVGTYLTGADLGGTYLTGADLGGADLRGADLGTGKVKTIAVALESGECRVKMGCHDRSVKEWDANFWNNENEFPNDGSVKSELRVIAYNTAKAWIELQLKHIA